MSGEYVLTTWRGEPIYCHEDCAKLMQAVAEHSPRYDDVMPMSEGRWCPIYNHSRIRSVLRSLDARANERR